MTDQSTLHVLALAYYEGREDQAFRDHVEFVTPGDREEFAEFCVYTVHSQGVVSQVPHLFERWMRLSEEEHETVRRAATGYRSSY